MTKIVLATASPYRKEIFETLGIPFEVERSNVDESQLGRNNPEELAGELAKLKAEAVARNHNDAIVIGFDSVGHFNGKILEKPKSKEEAFKRLQSLSGKNHQHYTGICIINTKSNKTVSKIDKTEIFMRNYSDEEIEEYLEQGSEFDRFALGYDTERYISASFIKKIEGNHLNLKGIPLSVLVEMLKEIGYRQK